MTGRAACGVHLRHGQPQAGGAERGDQRGHRLGLDRGGGHRAVGRERAQHQRQRHQERDQHQGGGRHHQQRRSAVSSARRPATPGAGRAELDPDPADRVQVPGLLGGLAELAAQPRDVHVHGLVRTAVGQPPDVREQVPPGHHLPGVLRQVVQQVELPAAQVQRDAVQRGLVRVRVEPQPADLQRRRRPSPRWPARRSTALILASIWPPPNGLTT